MKLLIDTNVFLEVLLSDAKAAEAKALLENAGGHDLFVSDFALHSIGLLLLRRSLPQTFVQFLEDTIEEIGISMASLSEKELAAVVTNASAFGLDFDDAYQYSVAEKYGLTLVSFDKDFDGTARGRTLPANIPQ